VLISRPAGYPPGFTAVAELDGTRKEMRLDFGILHLRSGQEFRCSAVESRELACHLIRGSAAIEWPGEKRIVRRSSLTEEMPSVLHVPAGIDINIKGISDYSEFVLVRAENDKQFEPRFLAGPEINRVILASGRAAEETKRELRIAADNESAPLSEMTFGEVLNYPGKWSSYPPHHHPHPEIYHYRFEPENGFGYAEEGGEVFKVTSGDTLLVAPHKVHPQTAAPGYAMVYIWAMPHLPGNRFGKDTRQFEQEHTWVLE
jgi:5-deoxy-glucuronate isomerase